MPRAAKPSRRSPKSPRHRIPLAPDELDLREERFVGEYLRCSGKIGEAAKRAGISSSTAAKYLKLDRVQEAIRAKQAKLAERLEISAERVLNELARIAFVDMRKLVEWGPSGVLLVDSTTIDDDSAAAVSKVTHKSGKSREISLETHSKVSALQLLGKNLGLFVDRVKVDNPEEIAREIAAYQAAIANTPGAFPAAPAQVGA